MKMRFPLTFILWFGVFEALKCGNAHRGKLEQIVGIFGEKIGKIEIIKEGTSKA